MATCCGERTLREKCLLIALFYALLSAMNITTPSIYLRAGAEPRWLLILAISEAATGLFFHLLLFIGAYKEIAILVRAWQGFTLIFTIPTVVISLGVYLVSLNSYWIVGTGMELLLCIWMWLQVHTYYSELTNQGTNPTSENPITHQQDQYGPAPLYNRPTTETI